MTDHYKEFAPRVESCISEVMARFPADSKAYYVEVHQHLAPLARQLERELAEAKAAQAAAWEQLAAFKSATKETK